MTDPSKHYPDVALKKLRDAVCRACPAQSPEVCLQNRKLGCYIDDGFDEMIKWVKDDDRAVIPTTQTRLEESPICTDEHIEN